MLTFRTPSSLNIQQLESMLKKQYSGSEYVVKRPPFSFFGQHIWIRKGPVAAVVTLKSDGDIRVRGQVNYQHRPILIAWVVALVLIRILILVVFLVCYFKYKDQYQAFEHEVAAYIQSDYWLDEIGKPDEDKAYATIKFD